MQFLKHLPFVSVMEDQRLDVAIWRTEPGEPCCEYAGELRHNEPYNSGYGRHDSAPGQLPPSRLSASHASHLEWNPPSSSRNSH